jgi:EAL domain-containing protein (putative c-di-GMP-specific phosphodiesterase class I)
MDAELKAARSLESGLRYAIETEQLELFYQPQFALSSREIRGVEALIRWPHEGDGYVPPGSFIPIAETSGLIVPLGEWVLRNACRQAKAWIAAGRKLRVGVNLSVVQLRQPGFSTLLERILRDVGLPPSALEIEVTENVFLDGSKSVIARGGTCQRQ